MRRYRACEPIDHNLCVREFARGMVTTRKKRRRRSNTSVGFMAGEEMQAMREQLGLTQSQLGILLGLTGADPKRSVGRYERGESRIPGPIIQLMRAYISGYRPPDWPTE